jgi:hypothetical protein
MAYDTQLSCDRGFQLDHTNINKCTYRAPPVLFSRTTVDRRSLDFLLADLILGLIPFLRSSDHAVLHESSIEGAVESLQAVPVTEATHVSSWLGNPSPWIFDTKPDSMAP